MKMKEYDMNDEVIETTRYEPTSNDYNTLLLRIDPSPALERLRYSLLCYKYDVQTKQWVKNTKRKAMMNEEGVESVMLYLEPRISVDKVLSNLTDKEIKQILRDCGKDLIKELFCNASRYDIKDDDHSKIHNIIQHDILMILNRAKQGLENKNITKNMDYREVSHRREAPQYNQEEQSTKKFNLFKGFR